MDTFKVRDTRRKNFFTIDNEFIDIIKEIGGNATAVYLYLCKCSDNETQQSFPSQDVMADKLGIYRETIIEKLKILKNHNLIKIEQTKEEGTGKWLHNTYTLLDKTVWVKTRHGYRVGKNPIRVEANTVSVNSDTNKTHILTIPISEKNSSKVVNQTNSTDSSNSDDSPTLSESQRRKIAADARRGRQLGFKTAPKAYPKYEKVVKQGTHAEHIR